MQLSLLFIGVLAAAGVRSTAAEGPVLLVANQNDHNLSVIDPAKDAVVATVAETGITGHEIGVYPPTHLAFVPMYGNSGVGKPGTDGSYIDVVDIATRKVSGKIDFGHGVRPHCVVYDPLSGLIYVTTELDQTVSIIDPKSLKIVGTVPTGQAESHMLALSHDGHWGYTANVGPGTVSVLDMKARKTVKIIPISGSTQRISISNDDKYVFTADQTKPLLAVLDTHSNTVTAHVDLPGLGYGTAPTRDGRWLLVAVPAKNLVAVVDLATLKVVRTVDVGSYPSEILVRPDGQMAYVACQHGHQVAAIDLQTWKLAATIETGRGSDGLAWAQ
jgi:YVTN family beta-propeller protein